MTDHLPALRAVARDRVGVPRCTDAQLTAAADAGLIRFKSWPSGHWQLTSDGLTVLAAGSEAETP